MEPERTAEDDDVATLCRWLDLGAELAANSGMDYHGQVEAMRQAGVPAGVAGRFVNLFPILAGRRFLAATGSLPKLADHYVVIDGSGNEQAVSLAECQFCQAVQWRLDRLDPADMLVIGACSCEVVALNGMLNRLGSQATEDVVAMIEIEAPRMGG
ncbi:hypothetical protein [Zavarzinella formosa]|uniref:hypothetical protein n=1 Tax=Zavarzinella formosa TaxID=360055 RepID=UPI0002F813CB|nr:hypothetical protein [Zavarzinella formosa]